MSIPVVSTPAAVLTSRSPADDYENENYDQIHQDDDRLSRSVERRRAAQGDPLAAMFQRLRIEDAEASVALSHARDCGCATCQRVAERAKRYKR